MSSLHRSSASTSLLLVGALFSSASSRAQDGSSGEQIYPSHNRVQPTADSSGEAHTLPAADAPTMMQGSHHADSESADTSQSSSGVTSAIADDQAALEALLSGPRTNGESDGPRLTFYGFADAGLQRWYGSNGVPGSPSAFSIGNVNLYMAGDLTHGFSSLIEVRFSYMPNGTSSSSGGGLTSTDAADSSNFSRTEQWGGIVMQRVHLDYSFRSWLNLRIGQYLTPYGIWNVDHGSPTIVPTSKPFIIGEGLFPQRQTGIAAFGSLLVGATTLGYHVTLSNGRSDILNSDYDKNKALGGRLFLTTDALGTLKVGVSIYGGRATSQPYSAIDFSSGSPRVSTRSRDQYDELALAADLQWDMKGLRLQSEAIVRQVRYLESGRKVYASPMGSTQSLVADGLTWGWYALAGYLLPWVPIMPFLLVEQINSTPGTSPNTYGVGPSGNVLAFTGGINLRPVPSVVLKGQATGVHLAQGSAGTIVSGQVAWAF